MPTGGPRGRRSRPPGAGPRVLVIVGLVAVAVVASALVGWRFARESPPVTGPILLISIDPLPRRACCASTAAVPPRTPNLDRLAAGATVFTRAYSHAAASLPAHASLLTGRLPFDHGIRDDVGFTLAPASPTLAARLADRGFDTGAAVSVVSCCAPRPGSAPALRATTPRGPAAADALTPPVERDSAATAAAAVAWLDEQGSERFFYALHLNGAAGRPRPGAAARPIGGRRHRRRRRRHRPVLDALRRKGWFDHALVVVTSASGAPPEAPAARAATSRSTPPALQVPLVVKMPEDAAPSSVDAPIQHIDLAPTVLDLVRAPGASSLPGPSVRRLLEGDDEAPRRTPRYAEAMSGALRFGWRS